MSVLAVEGVSKTFGHTHAVDDVSFIVDETDFVALLGPSGCGKTTLLRMLAGFEHPDTGRVIIGGADVTATPPHARPVNMMFQSYALFPHMTVAENVAFGLKQDGLRGKDLASRVDEALATVELSGLGARKPHQLSGGQQQRVALARCIAKRPKVLLLDEPLAALDKHLRERTQLELMALQRRLGIAFIVVTHDQDEAMTMATRVAVMDRGKILQTDTPQALYTRPASRAVAAFFGDVNLWDGVVAAPGKIGCAALAMDVAAECALPAGTAVTLAVRPEQIALVDDSGGLQGTVSDVIYRGTVSTYLVRTASGAVVRVLRQNGGVLFDVGDAVSLTWPESAVVVLPS